MQCWVSCFLGTEIPVSLAYAHLPAAHTPLNFTGSQGMTDKVESNITPKRGYTTKAQKHGDREAFTIL